MSLTPILRVIPWKMNLTPFLEIPSIGRRDMSLTPFFGLENVGIP